MPPPPALPPPPELTRDRELRIGGETYVEELLSHSIHIFCLYLTSTSATQMITFTIVVISKRQKPMKEPMGKTQTASNSGHNVFIRKYSETLKDPRKIRYYSDDAHNKNSSFNNNSLSFKLWLIFFKNGINKTINSCIFKSQNLQSLSYFSLALFLKGYVPTWKKISCEFRYLLTLFTDKVVLYL